MQNQPCRMTSPFWFALAAAVFLLAGCGAMSVSKPPAWSLADIRLEGVGLLEQRLALFLRVRNDNESDMEIKGLTCSLEINEEPFAQGSSPKLVRVPGYGDAVVKVSANAGTGSILRQLQTMALGGRDVIDYRLRGEADVRGLGLVPIDQTGDIPLPSLLDKPAAPRRKI